MSEAPLPEYNGDPARESFISNDELLMRRMLYKNKQYNPRAMPPILAGTFSPRKNDLDGLSFSRRRSDTYSNFLTAEQMKAACAVESARDRLECGVCAVVAGSVREIGLDIIYSPTDADPGHVHIKQINYREFEGDRATDESFAQIAIWIQKLVNLACDNVLIVPGPTSVS